MLGSRDSRKFVAPRKVSRVATTASFMELPSASQPNLAISDTISSFAQPLNHPILAPAKNKEQSSVDASEKVKACQQEDPPPSLPSSPSVPASNQSQQDGSEGLNSSDLESLLNDIPEEMKFTTQAKSIPSSERRELTVALLDLEGLADTDEVDPNILPPASQASQLIQVGSQKLVDVNTPPDCREKDEGLFDEDADLALDWEAPQTANPQEISSAYRDPEILVPATSSPLTPALSPLQNPPTPPSPPASPPSKRRRTKHHSSEDQSDGQPGVETTSDHKAKTSTYHVSDRRFFGRTEFNNVCLPASDGSKKVKAAVWPKKGPNTVAGRLQEIVCDACSGRLHWSCAGLEDNEAPDEDDQWYCPECEHIAKHSKSRTRPAKAQQARCIRPDCILRSHSRTEKIEGDEEMFRMVKIIGQKVVGRYNGKRLFRFLILWEGWEMCDSTWEPKKNVPSINTFYADFVSQANAEDKSTRGDGVVLLAEAETDWNAKGKLTTDRSKRYKSFGFVDADDEA